MAQEKKCRCIVLVVGLLMLSVGGCNKSETETIPPTTAPASGGTGNSAPPRAGMAPNAPPQVQVGPPGASAGSR
jgi:hypothetical protein